VLKYLITGTTGFIGHHLANFLAADDNVKVYAIDKVKSGFFDSDNIEEIVLDLAEDVTCLPTDIDVVIHLAAFNGTKYFYTHALDVIKDNTIPTLNLIRHYQETDISGFLYAGTPESTVLATDHFNYPIPTDELAPVGVENVLNPRWSYANSKALGEQMVATSGLPFTIIRFNNIYGPRQRDHFIPEFYERLKLGDLRLFGSHNTRSFLYLEDAIDATVSICKCPQAIGQIINIGGDIEVTILEVAEIIKDQIGVAGDIVECDAPEGSAMRRCPDTAKLKRLTGFTAKTSLITGIQKTIESYQ